jgi:hypothetical protein
MMQVLEALPDRFEGCYEASCGYCHYHDLLCPIASRVTVAHPGLTADLPLERTRMTAKTPSGWRSCSFGERRRGCTSPRLMLGSGAS